MDSARFISDDLSLEKQSEDDLSVAYEILTSRTLELIDRNTGQYVAPYPPLDQYALRTTLGQNWLLRSLGDPEKEILGIVSLIPNGGANDWDHVSFPINYLWVSSLFVSPRWKNKNLGPAILDKVKVEARTTSTGSVWLDCYLDSGFLEAYYIRNGFETIASQRFIYGDRSFNAALMRYLPNGESVAVA